MDDATLIATWFANIVMATISLSLFVTVIGLSVTEFGVTPTIIGSCLFVAFIATIAYLVKE